MLKCAKIIIIYKLHSMLSLQILNFTLTILVNTRNTLRNLYLLVRCSDLNELFLVKVNLTFTKDKMTENFINRKYPLSILTAARNWLMSIDRPILLKYKPKINTSDNLILIQVYNNKL